MVNIEELKNKITGKIILPNNPEYEKERRIFNGMINKHPKAIIKCMTVSDVIQSVKFLKGEEVSIRGGGHNVAGTSLCDGYVIDLSFMKGIWVDKKKQIARAQAGVVWRELDRETQMFGLAVPGGAISSTGIAGFTLGGGRGHISRMYGLACDNVKSYQLITAAGEFIEANEDEDKDLFWALKGGGGNFGIVTSFEYNLHKLGPIIYGGAIFFPENSLKDAIAEFYNIMIDHPEDLSGLFVITNAPPAPFIPSNWVGTLIGVSLLISTQPKEKAIELIKPLREVTNERLDHVDSVPYLAIQTLVDPLEPAGLRHYWKSHYTGKLDENALFDLIELRRKPPSLMSQIHLEPWGGKMKKGNNAFSFKNAEFAINIIGKWTDEKDDPRNIEWVRSTWNALKKYSIGGGYVNYEGDVSQESFKYSYDKDTYLKLKEIKRKYDPENFFHNNQNIIP
jgi:FAD/FMN-containing dehydrogenases